MTWCAKAFQSVTTASQRSPHQAAWEGSAHSDSAAAGIAASIQRRRAEKVIFVFMVGVLIGNGGME
jgi:hypothetical protein